MSLEDKNFWNEIKNVKPDGYIITSYFSSSISMRKSLKPVMLDVTSFDFVPYFPNTAKSLSKIIEEIYGIEFTNPPLESKNSGSLSDKIIKMLRKKEKMYPKKYTTKKCTLLVRRVRKKEKVRFFLCVTIIKTIAHPLISYK